MSSFKRNIYRSIDTAGECPLSLIGDSGTYTAGGSKTIFVLTNDGVISTPTVTIVTNPINGNAIVNVDNSITYTNISGSSDSLIYQVNNGECSSTATVNYYLATSPPAYYNINISNSTSISNCSGAGVSTYPISVYIERTPIIVGDIIYTNIGLTSIFAGDSTWYSRSSTFSMKINASGIVTEIDNSCKPLA